MKRAGSRTGVAILSRPARSETSFYSGFLYEILAARSPQFLLARGAPVKVEFGPVL